MNKETPMAPWWLWRICSSWGQETKYYNKGCSLCFYCSGNSKGFVSCETRNVDEDQMYMRNIFWSSNWQNTYISHKSQYLTFVGGEGDKEMNHEPHFLWWSTLRIEGNENWGWTSRCNALWKENQEVTTLHQVRQRHLSLSKSSSLVTANIL